MEENPIKEAHGQTPLIEKLKILNFLSIKKLECEFSQFTIITGEMGSGKSLAIKLLKYFQDVISRFFSYPYDDFCKYLEISEYFDELKRKFNYIFVINAIDHQNFSPFEIDYTFSCGEKTFSMSIKGKNADDIVIESPYLEDLLRKWKEYLDKNIENASKNFNPDGFKKQLDKNIENASKSLSPDSFDEFRHTLYDAIQEEFNQRFPILTTFIPASRAAMAYCSNFSDYFLDKYSNQIGTIKRQPDNPEYTKIVDEILKAQIKIEDDDSISLVSSDGRKAPLANASSGQQEIVYLLMQLSKLNNNSSYYGKARSLLIEEPEAQLYPYEQMKIINFIVRVYNDQKKSRIPVRFFITTHSPYVLNSLNNILNKGSLLKDYSAQIETINKEVSDNELPSLLASEVSAFHISVDKDENNKSTSNTMMDDNLIYPKKISDISSKINKFDVILSRLKNAFLEEKE